ncbi:MAG: hypothetical protein QF464_10410, partial [Myxococcota bacterium]|nr:hypothetical protein [Myxococcota bacterium]
MMQLRTTCLALTLCTLVLGPTTSASAREAQESDSGDSAATAETDEGQATDAVEETPSDAPGCRVALMLMDLMADPEGEFADNTRIAVLEVSPELYCWTAEPTDCSTDSPSTCPTTSALASVVRVFTDGYGFHEHIARDPEFRRLFATRMADALDQRPEGAKPMVIDLLDGVPFEDFVEAHNDCCRDIDDFPALFSELAEDIKGAVLRRAVPEAMNRTQEAIDRLNQMLEAYGMANAVESRKWTEARAREKARLEAELQRRLLALYAASERARRAASVAEMERRRLLAEELARASSAPPDMADIVARCRKIARSLVVGDDELRALAAEVVCLAEEAADHPGAVPRTELARLIKLFAALQETVIGHRLDGLRWARADFPKAPALLVDIRAIPLVPDAWKRKMYLRVQGVCTAH